MLEEKSAEKVRLDKWLWAVRLFKTRSQATTACDQGKIFVNDSPAKASRIVQLNDQIGIRRTGITRTYKVLKLISMRIGAKLVPDHCTELTDPKLLEEFRNRIGSRNYFRDAGTGRPTKKERRELDDFLEDI